MKIEVKPDPKQRLGGYALVVLHDIDAAATETDIVLQRTADSSYLGPDGWQGGRHSFGPYPVEQSAKDVVVRIGPEIVDHVEEYAQVDLNLPALESSGRIEWPPEVLPSPNAYRGGGVHSAGLQNPPGTTVSATSPPSTEPEPEPETDPEPSPASGDDISTDGPQEEKRRRSILPWVAGGLLAVVVLVLIGLWYVYPGLFPFLPPASQSVQEQDTSLTCTADAVNAVLRDPASDLEDIRRLRETCVKTGDVKSIVSLCERLIDKGDPGCLARYGRWYDPTVEANGPFPKNAGIAVRYYSEAAKAGAADAAEQKANMCELLRKKTDPLSANAVATYCE